MDSKHETRLIRKWIHTDGVIYAAHKLFEESMEINSNPMANKEMIINPHRTLNSRRNRAANNQYRMGTTAGSSEKEETTKEHSIYYKSLNKGGGTNFHSPNGSNLETKQKMRSDMIDISNFYRNKLTQRLMENAYNLIENVQGLIIK